MTIRNFNKSTNGNINYFLESGSLINIHYDEEEKSGFKTADNIKEYLDYYRTICSVGSVELEWNFVLDLLEDLNLQDENQLSHLLSDKVL